MGEALLSRLIAQKIYQPSEVIVSEPPATPECFEQQYGVQVTADNRVVALETSVILLAVKPQLFEVIARGRIDCSYTSSRITTAGDFNLSRCALSKLEAAFPQLPVIRAMPYSGNGAGITAISSGSHTRKATKTQRRNCSLR